MKIHSTIGSKDRLFEVMQRVNKIKINEDYENVNNGINVLDMMFNKLKNGELNVTHTDILTNNNESNVSLDCSDGDNLASFKFKVIANQNSLDGVFNLENATLIEFDYKNKMSSNITNIDEFGLKEFNAQHSNELIDVISDYVDFDEEQPSDEMEIDENYIDAIKKIDSYPYGGVEGKMQDGDGYVDNKPINPKIKVKSPELDNYIYEDNNLLDVDVEKTSDNYFNGLNPKNKTFFIDRAKGLVDKILSNKGISVEMLTNEEYVSTIKKIANRLFEDDLTRMNENDDSYPDPIGSKFKAKSKYPKKKKKPQTTVNIDESESDEMTDILLGYKPKNVNCVSEDIIGTDNSKSVVGDTPVPNNDINSSHEDSKYNNYLNKDFNTLNDNEKEEFFQMWLMRKNK